MMEWKKIRFSALLFFFLLCSYAGFAQGGEVLSPVFFEQAGVLNSSPPDRWYVNGQFGLFFGMRRGDAPEHFLASPSFQLSGGYIYSHRLQLGLGVGSEQFGKIGVYPVYAELRGLLVDKKFSPFYVIKLGKGFAELEDDFRYQEIQGKLMVEGQLGLSLRLGDFYWEAGTGYHLQNVRMEGNSMLWNNTTMRSQERSLRRMIFTSSIRYTF